MLQVTIATMCNNNNQQQQQQQQDLSPCGSLDAADKVLMKPPPVASNESVLQHFQQGNTRLYSYAQQTEATARQVLANKMVRPSRKIILSTCRPFGSPVNERSSRLWTGALVHECIMVWA